MTESQKLENEKFFKQVIQLTKDGGIYSWPDAKETYTISDKKIYGTTSGIKKIKEITTSFFHQFLIIK